jgi:hypothetical protein
MPPRSYKVGDTTTTGHVVAEILGQSPAACVYTSTKDELRWAYYANDGVLPDEHGAVVAKFDTLMDEVRSLDGTLDSKRPLYTLLGKNLFVALNATKPTALPDIFSRVEKKITEYTTKTASSRSHPAGKTSKLIPSQFDLAIVCALHEPELVAIFSFSRWVKGPRMPGDPQTYYSSTWTTKSNKKLRVVVAAPNHMGLTAAGVLSAKMILQFRPKLPTTPAATAVAPQAPTRTPKPGWENDVRNAGRRPTCTSSSPCPTSEGRLSAVINKLATTSCSVLRPRRSSSWPRPPLRRRSERGVVCAAHLAPHLGLPSAWALPGAGRWGLRCSGRGAAGPPVLLGTCPCPLAALAWSVSGAGAAGTARPADSRGGLDHGVGGLLQPRRARHRAAPE